MNKYIQRIIREQFNVNDINFDDNDSTGYNNAIFDK